MSCRIWIDVDDLLIHAETGQRMTGIFRVVFELCQALQRTGSEGSIGFLRHDDSRSGYSELRWADIRAAVVAPEELAISSAPEARPVSLPRRLLHAYFRWLRPATSVALGRLIRALGEVGRAFVALVRAVLGITQLRKVEARPWEPRPGDIIFLAGAGWLDQRSAARIAAARGRGLRYAALIHDIIPLRRPEWCDRGHIRNFRRWISDVLPSSDHLLAISRATAAELSAFAREQRIA
ncbi:MAG TPA: hypothetical protein VGC80_17810, partial [Acetobacteraceae bacterium]